MNLFIIINGFSTGAALVDKLIAACNSETKFMHLVTPDIIKLYKINTQKSYSASDPRFLFEVFYDNDLAKLRETLKIYKVIGVSCGCESEGVILRDLLADQFKLPNNNIATLNCRINKYYMTEQLKRFGLPHIKQEIIETEQELTEKLGAFSTYPVILKPLDSGDSEGIFNCKSKEMVYKSFKKLHNATSLFNRKINKILIQEFIMGVEYAINTISFEGGKYLTDVWRYDISFSETGVRLCKSCTLIKDFEPSIIEYVNNCLDALGCYYGAAHTEVIDRSGSYYMLENGFRLMGGMSNELLKQCLKTTQLDALVTLYCNPQQIKHLEFGVTKILKLVNLVNPKNGIIQQIKNFNLLKNLKSYHDSTLLVKEGSQVFDANISNRLARIVLISEDPYQVEADYQHILEQQDKIFIIE